MSFQRIKARTIHYAMLTIIYGIVALVVSAVVVGIWFLNAIRICI